MKSHKFLSILSLSILASLATIATAQTPTTLSAPTVTINTQMMERELALINAPIKSNADLNTYLASNIITPFDALPQSEKQVFMDSLMFSTNALGSFNYAVLEDNLTPTEIYSVLALFGFQSITPKLNGAKVKTNLDRAILRMDSPGSKVVNTGKTDFGGFGSPLSMGGTGSTAPGDGNSGTDHFGYYCESPGTCRVDDGAICTSNC